MLACPACDFFPVEHDCAAARQPPRAPSVGHPTRTPLGAYPPLPPHLIDTRTEPATDRAPRAPTPQVLRPRPADRAAETATVQRSAVVLDNVRVTGRLTPHSTSRPEPSSAHPPALRQPERATGHPGGSSHVQSAHYQHSSQSSFSGLSEPDRVTCATVPLRPVGGGTSPLS